MRSDAKLGLALGMLVIGFAVAFCFPRPGRESRISELRKPTLSVDEPEIEFVQLRSLREEQNSPDGMEPLQQLNPLDRDESQLLILPAEASVADSSSGSASGKLPAEISAQSGLNDLLFPGSLPIAEEDISFTPVLPEKMSIAEFESKVTTYRVQAGDTLSGIAMKTLGSYSRYLDIYAANRNQLSSPDDLRLGMELHIPSSISDTTNIAKTKPIALEPQSAPEHLGSESGEQQRFRNTQGAPFLSDRRTEVPVHQIQSKRVTTHIIQSGDTLERIAVRYFGTTRAVEQLRKANPELTRNPQRLRPGVILQLLPKSRPVK